METIRFVILVGWLSVGECLVVPFLSRWLSINTISSINGSHSEESGYQPLATEEPDDILFRDSHSTQPSPITGLSRLQTLCHLLVLVLGTFCSFTIYGWQVLFDQASNETRQLLYLRLTNSWGVAFLWILCLASPLPKQGNTGYLRWFFRWLIVIFLTLGETFTLGRRIYENPNNIPTITFSSITSMFILSVTESLLVIIYAGLLFHMDPHFLLRLCRNIGRQYHNELVTPYPTATITSPTTTSIHVSTARTGSSPMWSLLSSQESSRWLKRWRTLWPFLWPHRNLKLQLYLFVCLLTIIGTRVLNVLVPISFKYMIDSLASMHHMFSWKPIAIYIGLRFLQGGGLGSFGLLSNLRSFLWISIGQFTNLELAQSLFRHIHHLSLQFHLNRKTGELMRVMDRGTSSIDNLFNTLLFNTIPTLVDILVACVYFAWAFDAWFGGAILLTMILYLGLTIRLTRWRVQFRSQTNEFDNQLRARAVDSLLNYETVKYYTAENDEVHHYRHLITEYNRADRVSQWSLNLLNSTQGIVILAGLGFGCLYGAHRITLGQLTVGDFLLFFSYATQLYAPLNWFGTYYRTIQQNFIDMESMLELMEIREDIREYPLYPDIQILHGHIRFDQVSFTYDNGVQALNRVSFEVLPGQTVAIVGPSGSGKSTIVRLLFGFYDVQEGAILIDGQDLRRVNSKSLREHIGVVPQDTILFNETIRYNILYGRRDATNDQIEEAAKRAEIHRRILDFPQGYESIVGERGLRLSGGEKQRVAIARTLLKVGISSFRSSIYAIWVVRRSCTRTCFYIYPYIYIYIYVNVDEETTLSSYHNRSCYLFPPSLLECVMLTF